MAFPQVIASGFGNSGANATQHTITLPAHSAGDLIVVLFGDDGTPTTSVGASTGTWTNLVNVTGSPCRGSIWFRIVAGAGETLRLDTSASEAAAWDVYVYDAGTFDPTVPPERSVPVTFATSTSPDAGSLSPSWGALDTGWIVFYYWDGNVAHSAYPANYTANQLTSRWVNAEGVGVASATRDLNAASEDPGAGTLASSTPWFAFVVAIKPATAITGTGTTAAQPATVAGAGVSGSSGAGAPAAGAAAVAGAGVSGSVGDGALASQPSEIAGAGTSGSAGAGALAAQPAAVDGAGSVAWGGVGALVASDSEVAGAGVSGSAGAGAAVAQGSQVDGAGVSGSVGAGALVADASMVTGVGNAYTVNPRVIAGLDGSVAVRRMLASYRRW